MADMSVDVLRNELTNPARSYLWEIYFTTMIGGGAAGKVETRCQSTSIPSRGTPKIHIPFKGTAGVNVPGKLRMSQTWRCSFVEGTDRKVFDALYAWQQAIINARTGLGAPDPSVKTVIHLKCLDANGSAWLSIKLVGAWLEDMPEHALNYDANTIIRLDGTFSYDYWEKE